MALELIVNLLLLGGSVFCYWYVGSTMPVSADNELGAEQWPQALLVLLILGLAWNILICRITCASLAGEGIAYLLDFYVDDTSVH